MSNELETDETESSIEYSQSEPRESDATLARLKILARGPLFSCIAALLVLLILWPTFFYPFDRDQNTFAYVAREWNRGALPYYDTWDLKPPLIYTLYAALERGSAGWIDFTFRVRVFDVVVLMLTGVLLAKIARRWTNTSTSLAVVAWYAVLILHGGTSFLAQTETWANACIAASILCALQAADKNYRVLAWLLCSGFFAGVAAAFKWPLILIPLPFLLAHAFCAIRTNASTTPILRRCVQAILLVLLGIFVAPFATWFFLYQSNLLQEYLTQQSLFVKPYTQVPLVLSLPDGRRITGGTFFQLGMMLLLCVVWFSSRLAPVVFAFVGGCQRGLWQGRGRLLAVTWLLISLSIVLLQRKFLTYHWLIILPALAILSAAGIASTLRNKQAWGGALATFAAFLWIFWQRPTEHRDALLLTTGNLPAAEWVARFPTLHPKYASLETARYLADQTNSSDTIFIWGFEPQIYLAAQRRAPTRFFYNLPLSARYAPALWRNELLRDLKANPPKRFIVIRKDQSYIISGVWGDSQLQLQRWPELNRWLHKNYQHEKTMGLFIIYKPKNHLQ